MRYTNLSLEKSSYKYILVKKKSHGIIYDGSCTEKKEKDDSHPCLISMCRIPEK